MSVSYPARFGITALALTAVTLVLVLVVLPRRYILSSGFREAGVSFPVTEPTFTPSETVRRPAPPPPMGRMLGGPDGLSPATVPGPAEMLWTAVTPLLQTERWDEALPFFRWYLGGHPGDRNVEREYAITLIWAGRAGDAVPVLRRLVVDRDGADRDTELLLARTLRDLGRPGEADAVYGTLWEARPDPALAAEWARAWAWHERYGEAVVVLCRGRERFPDDPELTVELARTFYALNGLDAASALLASLDEPTLRARQALALRDDVEAARYVPDAPPTRLPSRVDEALRARMDGDHERAEALLREAVAEDEGDRAAWRALADLLEYELQDMEGSRSALLRVAELGGDDPALQLRIARLEMWTDRTEEARDRLDALLAGLPGGGPGAAAAASAGSDGTATDPLRRADVLALLGDLARWDGDRPVADRRYQEALRADPRHASAREGLDALRDEAERSIRSAETPGPRVIVTTFRDSDDFTRVDLAAGWRGVDGRWVLGATSGSRRLEGFTPAGPFGDLQGAFGSVEVARWWRLGTLRTAAEIGGESVQSGVRNLTFRASVRLLEGRGANTELRYERGPAYPLTVTLQSAAAEVVQNRFSVQTSRPLSPRWTLDALAQVANLSPGDIGPGLSATTRLFGSTSAARRLDDRFVAGLEVQMLGYTGAAPTMSERPIFWDPRTAVSALPFARWEDRLGGPWSARARLAGGLAAVDERRRDGWTVVPQISGEAGVALESGDLRGGVDLFYLQSRSEGYRAWGLRFTLGAPGFLGLGGPEGSR
ncbi:MAG: hypothetical protein PVI57_07510 [Gemmatimonadota bacterium]